MTPPGGGATQPGEEREFARIQVGLGVGVQPLDPQRAERLRADILSHPSVWAPTDASALRDLAATGGSGHEAVLAQSILELATQLVRLRNRMSRGDGPVCRATLVQLSGGGGQLEGDLPLDAGDLFELRFDDDDHNGMPPLTALGRVIHRTEPQAGVGFCFESIHARDQELLIRAIYMLQRRALRESGRTDGE
jgi:hypothetical protein